METRILIVLLLVAACGSPDDPAAGSDASDASSAADSAAAAPPTIDVWLFDLSPDGEPTMRARVTDRVGYDNQPHFGDGQLLFTSDRAGSMDTFMFDVESGTTEAVTATVEGEYSPTVIPDRPDWFSAIRMDADGVQELWQYPLSGPEAPSPVAEIDRVGYHTWVGNDRVLFFRLGRPNSLQLVSAGAADTLVVAQRVGRSLHRIPGEDASSYSITLEDDSREIRRFDWETGVSSAIAVPLAGQQDYAWTPDGMIVMAVGNELYGFRPDRDVDWNLLGDLGLTGTSRMAVSPDGGLLAVVAERD